VHLAIRLVPCIYESALANFCQRFCAKLTSRQRWAPWRNPRGNIQHSTFNSQLRTSRVGDWRSGYTTWRVKPVQAIRPGPTQAQTTALMPSRPPVVTFVQDDATRPQVVSAPIENPAWKNAQPVLRNGVATLPTRGAGTNSPKAPTNTASSANRTSVAPKTNRKGRPRSD